VIDSEEIAEAGRYGSLSEAGERALVVLAMGSSYWLFEENGEWVLYTTEADLPRISRELAAFEEENHQSPVPAADVLTRVSPLSLILYTWGLALFFAVTRQNPGRWNESGASTNVRILGDGEWYRVITALTLHSDFSHLAGNIVVGIIFAVSLIPLLGTGVTWFLILFTGALGNAINALVYRGSWHSSIGASTAIFGALGLLVGCRVHSAIRDSHEFRRSVNQLVIPIGAGFALLALLGTGGEQTDYMAHLWGFLAGIPIGAFAMAARIHSRLASPIQLLLACSVPVICVFAWMLAFR
jgi:rhomboid protease GluP